MIFSCRSVANRTWVAFALVLLALFQQTTFGALLDAWRAESLVGTNGIAVPNWSSVSNHWWVERDWGASNAVLIKDATLSGHSAVHFDRSPMSGPSRVAGLSAFSIAAVVRVAKPGTNEGSQWWGKTGIVDASQTGTTNDWGLCVAENGGLGFGSGDVTHGDTSLFLDQPLYPSVVDGRFHVIVATLGNGAQTLYVDRLPPKTTAASTEPRSAGQFAFGGVGTKEPSRTLLGDIVEVQIHDAALTSLEASNVIAALSEKYLTNRRPVIKSFSASQDYLPTAGLQTKLAWQTEGALRNWITPGYESYTSQTGSVWISANSTMIFTLNSSNAYGVSKQNLKLTVASDIPIAQPQLVTMMKNKSLQFLLTGTDPKPNHPFNPQFAIATPPQHGMLSGIPPTVVYKPLTNYVGLDSFTFTYSDGLNESPAAAVDIWVRDEAVEPPHAIFIDTDEIDASAQPGAYLATLRGANSNGLVSCTLVSGPGDTHNGMFTLSYGGLFAAAGFPTVPGTNLSIRVRASTSPTLYDERTFLLRAKQFNSHPVINEIHYNPSENTNREEFVEFYNPTDASISLAQWRLQGGVDYTFPRDAAIGAKEYLVVAANPPTLSKRFAVSALGPWTGNLSSEGERVTLRDPAGNIVDEVNYRSEFPWPVAANGNGPSMELIHPALDNDLGSSWSCRTNLYPSPLRQNYAFATSAAPNIRQVAHSPRVPASTNRVLVTAKVTDPDGVNHVELSYQIVLPGRFVPSILAGAPPVEFPPSNPEFETRWLTTQMRDDGCLGDETAGDNIFSVLLPPQPNRTLVRYRIKCTDRLSQSRRAPFPDDPSLNFAYFVYDGIPAYGSTSSEDLQRLPVYFLVTAKRDFDACAAYDRADQISDYSSARFHFNWPGAFVYDGEVYDHVRYRLRGANGRHQPGKRNFRIKFNDGRHLAAKDEFGKPYPRKWPGLTTAKGQSNRGTLTFSLNEYMNYYLYNLAGVPAPYSHFFHWRVVRGEHEAPNLYDGDFYGGSWAQEEYNGAFLESHNLPKGNLYKLINSTTSKVQERRYQGPFAVTDGSDANRVISMIPKGQTEEWLTNNVNYTNWYSYHTVNVAVRNFDTWQSADKNAAWYFDTNYATTAGFGRFWTLPWDTTDTWGPTWNYGQDLAWTGVWGATNSTNLQRDYRNTMREMRDLLFQSDQICPFIDAVAARFAPIAQADLLRWSNAPAPAGASYKSMSSPGPALSEGLPGYVKNMKRFMFTGGYAYEWADMPDVSIGGWIQTLDSRAADTSIPLKPSLYYVGQPGYPMNTLTFECLAFSDPQGNDTFGAMQWRLAEVWDTNCPPADGRLIPPLEWNAVWTSGSITNWTNRMTFPAIYVQTNKLYRARVRHMDNTHRWSKWSDPIQFKVTPVDVHASLRAGLRFSEIMYNPPVWGGYASDELEFLELKNTSSGELDLSGLVFAAGITFTFPTPSLLAPGNTFLLARNASAIEARYPGASVNGIYTGRLDNAGETIRLSTPAGHIILETTYKDSPPWPVTADGMGWSLVLADPVSGTYHPSASPGGTPGSDESSSTRPAVVINELLTHTDPPQTDSVEVFNPTDRAVDLSGWYLSDNAHTPKKYQIPVGTVIPPGGYHVFTESDFNAGGNAFMLSSLGDDAYLFGANASGDLNGYVHAATFGPSKNGVSFGRYLNSMGLEDFLPLMSLTLGTNNSCPKVGPVVISEIMFQPPPLGTNENYAAEFIELQNVTSADILLADSQAPENTWKLGNAVNYAFPPNIVLGPAERLLVVGFDPSDAAALLAFRTQHNLTTNVPVLGPWAGRLDNSGETLELKCPDTPQLDGTVPYVLVDKVAYRSTAPWPMDARGTGHSLHRVQLLSWANDPLCWSAAPHTAGMLNDDIDTDRDEMPDGWEWRHGLDPFTADGNDDDDVDGLNNRSEWVAGTDPHDAGSCLAFNWIAAGDESIELQFLAMAHRTYSVLEAEDIAAPVWTKVADVAAGPTNHLWTLTHPASSATRFFKIIAPAKP